MQQQRIYAKTLENTFMLPLTELIEILVCTIQQARTLFIGKALLKNYLNSCYLAQHYALHVLEHGSYYGKPLHHHRSSFVFFTPAYFTNFT